MGDETQQTMSRLDRDAVPGAFFVLGSTANDFGRDPDNFLYLLNTSFLAEFPFPTPSECRGKEGSFKKVFGGGRKEKLSEWIMRRADRDSPALKGRRAFKKLV